jgi:hypothetical protein
MIMEGNKMLKRYNHASVTCLDDRHERYRMVIPGMKTVDISFRHKFKDDVYRFPSGIKIKVENYSKSYWEE